ncbi:MAG: cytochrome b N-terminal domain-containing protein [Elusimicrobiota bacterium]|mgnify:CR=1 FL=1
MSVSAWLCERTGIDRVWAALMERRIPEARGWAGLLYTLGSATMLVFLVQTLTGFLLALNYVSAPDHAYDSVRYIDTSVIFGRLVRGLHHWGSSFMVVLSVLHMLRVYFMGSYKYPREATWLAGVGLLLLVLGFSFTGYLLPWDQKAYWATVVGTTIAEQTPVVGPLLGKILRGGDAMGPATLSRFYAFHVLALPALTAGLITVHLFLVIWHGISDPPRRGS